MCACVSVCVCVSVFMFEFTYVCTIMNVFHCSCTGDLEDVLCSIAWPMFCFLCGVQSPCGRDSLSPRVVLFLASACTLFVLLAGALLVVVALPETVCELIRVTCLESITTADTPASA
jgi:hypothetical protein